MILYIVIVVTTGKQKVFVNGEKTLMILYIVTVVTTGKQKVFVNGKRKNMNDLVYSDCGNYR